MAISPGIGNLGKNTLQGAGKRPLSLSPETKGTDWGSIVRSGTTAGLTGAIGGGNPLAALMAALAAGTADYASQPSGGVQQQFSNADGTGGNNGAPSQNFWRSNSDQITQSSLLRPGQVAAQDEVLKSLMQLLGNLNNPEGRYEGFGPIEQKARTDFETQTVPLLAERFTSQFGPGANRGSAFRGELSKAGTGLDQGIAALRAQYGLQNQALQNQLINTLAGSGLARSLENNYFKGTPGVIEKGASTLIENLPKLWELYQNAQKNRAANKVT